MNSNHVFNKFGDIKTFSNENEHRLINIAKARRLKQEKQKQLIDKNKETQLYNEKLQKIKQEKKQLVVKTQ